MVSNPDLLINQVIDNEKFEKNITKEIKDTKELLLKDEYLTFPAEITITGTYEIKSTWAGDFEVFNLNFAFDGTKNVDLTIQFSENWKIYNLETVNTTLVTYWYTIDRPGSKYQLVKLGTYEVPNDLLQQLKDIPAKALFETWDGKLYTIMRNNWSKQVDWKYAIGTDELVMFKKKLDELYDFYSSQPIGPRKIDWIKYFVTNDGKNYYFWP